MILDVRTSMPTSALPLVYSAPWCGYCIRLKAQMDREGVAYEEIDVDANPEVLPKLEELNGGEWIIPTVEFSDGSALVNPSVAAVVAHLEQLSSDAEATA
jgi:mycoredoxin